MVGTGRMFKPKKRRNHFITPAFVIIFVISFLTFYFIIL